MAAIAPAEGIGSRIFLIRARRVMLSTHLASLYGVQPRALVQAVKRNRDRFPSDFMFQITAGELAILKSQIVISSWGGARRARPYAFTEQGVAMLASVLRSRRAVLVNIQILRAFVKLREVLASNRVLARTLAQLEKRIEGHDDEIAAIFDALRQLMEPSEKSGKRIGFQS